MALWHYYNNYQSFSLKKLNDTKQSNQSRVVPKHVVSLDMFLTTYTKWRRYHSMAGSSSGICVFSCRSNVSVPLTDQLNSEPGAEV